MSTIECTIQLAATAFGIAPNHMTMIGNYCFPANAVPCSMSTGVNFMAPPGFSVSNIAANGATNGLSGVGPAVGQFGYYDYQRYVIAPGQFNFNYSSGCLYLRSGILLGV